MTLKLLPLPNNDREVLVRIRELTFDRDGVDSPETWAVARWRDGGFYDACGMVRYVVEWIEKPSWEDVSRLSVLKSELWAAQYALTQLKEKTKRENENRNLPRSADT